MFTEWLTGVYSEHWADQKIAHNKMHSLTDIHMQKCSNQYAQKSMYINLSTKYRREEKKNYIKLRKMLFYIHECDA